MVQLFFPHNRQPTDVFQAFRVLPLPLPQPIEIFHKRPRISHVRYGLSSSLFEYFPSHPFILVEFHVAGSSPSVVFAFTVVILIIFEIGSILTMNVPMVVVIDVKIVTLKIAVHVGFPNVSHLEHRSSFNSDLRQNQKHLRESIDDRHPTVLSAFFPLSVAFFSISGLEQFLVVFPFLSLNAKFLSFRRRRRKRIYL